MPNAKALWLRQTEAARIAQVAVVIEILGDLGYLKVEAAELDPISVAEAIVKNVDIDGVLHDQSDVAPPVEAEAEFLNKQSLVDPEAPICPDCGNRMYRRTGKYGPFWGCSAYTNGQGPCRKTISIR